MRHHWKLIGLVILAVLVFFWLIKAPIMSAYLTSEVGVPVTVRAISIWPDETNMRHFRLENPYQYRSRTAFEVNHIKINYRWPALTADPHEIDLIHLQDVVLNIYINSTSRKDNNWADIGSKIPPRRSDTEVLVHKLIVSNLTVKTAGPGAEVFGLAGERHFDHMEFSEISSEDGFPTKELIRNIFEGAGLKQYLEKLFDPIEQIKNAADPFKIFGKAPEKTQGLQIKD